MTGVEADRVRRRPPWIGAVLAGGRSRRMGRDKALVRVAGRPLVAVAAGALRDAGAQEILVVGGDGPGLLAAVPDARTVPDLHPGEGPLGGILTAFGVAAASDPPPELVAVVACDMPALDAATVTLLVEAAAEDDRAGLAAAVVDGRPQPLTAVWRPAQAEALLAESFAAGERAPRRLLPRLRVIGVAGVDPRSVADVDSPQDLAHYAEDVDPDREVATVENPSEPPEAP